MATPYVRYIVQVWTSTTDYSLRYEHTTKRAAMKAAAGDARAMGARRVTEHYSDELARWTVPNHEGGGVLVWQQFTFPL